MNRKGIALIRSVVTLLLLLGFTMRASAIVRTSAGGDVVFTRIAAQLLCIGCTLAEVRDVQPGRSHLYELNDGRGKIVIDMQWDNEVDRTAWEEIVGSSSQLPVRAKNDTLQPLTIEKNVLKKFVMTGTLYGDRTLDLQSVTVTE